MPRPSVAVSNRQSCQPVSRAAVQRWTQSVLQFLHCDGDIGIHLVGVREMTRLNQQFLQHEGSTDIITFDHGSTVDRLVGELFISIPDAVAQAASFRTTWESELGRYIIHGLLHLAGEDDLAPAARRRMKRREGILLRRVSAHMTPDALHRRRPSLRRSADPRRPARAASAR